MNRPPAPAHWIRANHVTRLPRRHIIIDTEARQVDEDHKKVQTFRMASAAFDHQTKAGCGWRPTEREQFTTTADLWRWVDARTQAGRRTIVVAHNLSYDLRIGAAFVELPRLGWRLDMIRLDGGSAWCQWRRGDRSLSMVDTVSWFGVGLDKIGQLLGMTKPALPAFDAPDAVWFERCDADVEILRCAWRRVLDWIEADDLGNWKPTGAGQGWAAFRHRWLDSRILHHDSEHIAALEREASWTGRCEAWRHGRLPSGVWSEWDFEAAYAHVAEDEAVPVRLRGHLGPRGAQKALERTEGTATLVRCRITTDVPVAPTRGPHGIVWPVGTFTSWLWDIEAAHAQAAGAHVECLEGWGYDSAPALRSWATWVLDRLDDTAASFDPLLRLVVKGWSRTLIGRFGSRWSTWEDYGEAHEGSVSLGMAYDADADRHFRLMQIGERCMAETDRLDAPDGAVHVMSWIMAACRVRLWAAMTVAGLEHVAYIDTDSVLVDEAGSSALRAAGLPGLRVKGSWRNVEVIGPRQLVMTGKLRAAGIPRAAVQVGRRSWDAEVWRSLPASLRSGELDSVVIRDRTYTLRGVDNRRAHLLGGSTAPFASCSDVPA